MATSFGFSIGVGGYTANCSGRMLWQELIVVVVGYSVSRWDIHSLIPQNLKFTVGMLVLRFLLVGLPILRVLRAAVLFWLLMTAWFCSANWERSPIS